MSKVEQVNFNNQERWQFPNIEQSNIDTLAKRYDLDPLLAKLLISRKIQDQEHIEIDDFLNPPFSLLKEYKGISLDSELEKALKRLTLAKKKKEKVLINGDPDADGITGTSVLVIGLRELGYNVDYDFPTRATEGHGLHPRIIDEAKKEGVSLVLTIDCGTREVKSIEYANQQGIDVIVCDHHRVGKIMPPCHAMLNPYLVEGYNPMKVLAGAGIGLKLIIALYDHLKEELPEPLLNDLTGITSLGTISDRMSLLSPHNRIIIKHGIDAINKTNKEGLKALKAICTNNDQPIKPRDIARTIVPRLNAPGRIGNTAAGIPDSNIVVDLLLIGSGKKNRKKANIVLDKFTEIFEKSKDPVERNTAFSEAAKVDDINEQRKLITSKIEDEIDYLIEAQVDVNNDKVIIIQGKDWNPGVIGIDTDRLKERFLRPSIILTEDEDSDYIRGSSRSIPTINIYQHIETVSEKFEDQYGRKLFLVEAETAHGKQLINAFGGHAQACGFTIHRKDIPVFKTMIKEEVGKLPSEQFEYHYEILETLDFSDITTDLIDRLDTLSPYGQHFDYPTFYLRNCAISALRPFGNKYQEARTPHADFVVSNPRRAKQSQMDRIDAVGFGLFEKLTRLRAEYGHDAELDILFVVELDQRKRGRRKKANTRLRLNVVDARLSEDTY